MTQLSSDSKVPDEGSSAVTPSGGVPGVLKKKRGKLVAVLVGAAVVASSAGAYAWNQVQVQNDENWATVVRVVDGDTFEGTIAGRQETVRLLNVDTPETKHPDKPVQCMGPEATEMLEDLLKPGDRVRLEYDIDRTDRYGRTLAGVFKDDSLVNADLAREGLGVAVVFEPNRKFYDEVLEAQQEAEAAGDGLFDPQIDCTLPAQEPALAPLEALAEAPVPTDAAGLADAIAGAASVIAAGEVLQETVGLITGGSVPHLNAAYGARAAALAPRVDSALTAARAHQTTLAKAQEDLQRREAEAQAEAERKAKAEAEAKAKAEAAAKAEAERQAQAKAAAKAEADRQAKAKAAAKAEADRQAKAKAKADAAKKAKKAPAKKAPAKSGSNGGGGSSYPGYNGPRCYAPGGQSWKPCG